jgi:hypothetical protein
VNRGERDDRKDRKMSATYRWKITTDRIGDNYSVGLEGPGDAPETIPAHWECDRFRMLDDDGEVYYHGVVYAEDLDSEEACFGPLDDFGTPNAGCTIIQRRNEAGEWETI